jgi:hypothetical protein
MPKNSLSLPDHVVQLLSAADARNGLPAGTMFAVMQQESGGRFLDAPDTKHYPSGVAPNGKKSSAFGPFGILESTAAAPGYGVAPLKDKSLEEQVRFASDYLGGRIKARGGDVVAGLADYGEGPQYGQQVAARIKGVPMSPRSTGATAVAQQDGEGQGSGRGAAAAPAPAAPIVFASEGDGSARTALAAASAALIKDFEPATVAPFNPENDPWTQFQRRAQAAGLTPESLTYGRAEPAPVSAPAPGPVMQPGMSPSQVADLYDIPVNTTPNLGVLHSLRRLGRKAA